MPEDKLILTFVPSLVSLLLAHEQSKGAPLTEQEVLEIRDKATVVALPEDVAVKVTAERGYRDIHGDHCWEEVAASPYRSHRVRLGSKLV